MDRDQEMMGFYIMLCTVHTTQVQGHTSFSSIVRSARYVRSVNIWIDAKCLVSAKCLSSTKSLTSAKSLTSTKSLPSAKCLPTVKSLAFAKFLVIDKHLIDENLSNMTEMSSSNNFGHWKLLKWYCFPRPNEIKVGI